MEFWQQISVSIYGLVALGVFISGFRACYSKNKAFEDTPISAMCYGAFVQADKVIFGLFWFVASLIAFIVDDWLLFLLIFSVFWLVRSVGETLYWMFQQFHPRPGNDPQKFWFYRFFKNDSVWFVNQIYWQCITVITVISSVYLAHLWLQTL
jgi:hypothetical protein